MIVGYPQVVFFCLISLVDTEIHQPLSGCCWLLRCLSSLVLRRGPVPQFSVGAVHFVQHASMHQWRAFGSPSHDKAAFFHAQRVLGVPENMIVNQTFNQTELFLLSFYM